MSEHRYADLPEAVKKWKVYDVFAHLMRTYHEEREEAYLRNASVFAQGMVLGWEWQELGVVV